MTNTVSARISDEDLSSIIHIESAGKVKAKAPTSSASGLGQFINGTWLGVIAKHTPKWSIARSKAELLALNTASPCSRFNAVASIEMLARFTEDNARTLGPGYACGDLYLAHFAGAGTARVVLRADPLTPASSVFSAAAVQANRSILAGRTCGQVRAWSDKKMKAASGRNWVGVYWRGDKAIVPPKEKAKAAATATAGAGTAGGAVQQGLEQGWGITEWSLCALAAIVVIGGIVAAVVWWRKRNTIVRIEQQEMAHGLV